MNILIVSTQNPFKVSGIVANNLYKGLKGEKDSVKVLIKHYTKFDSKDFVSMETNFDVFMEYCRYRFKQMLKFLGFASTKIKTDSDYHIQDFDQTVQYYSTKQILKKIRKLNIRPDVIICLFQQNFLNARNLYELNKSTGAKIFLYLMDTAPLTGLCHYSWDCQGYLKGCGKCPAIYSKEENDQSSLNFDFKYKYLHKTDIEIIAPTEWQKKQVLQSLIFKRKVVHKMLLSIDPIVYQFIPKNQAKEKLGIPIDRKVIFFGATYLHHKRKGMKYLVEALQILNERFNHKTDHVLLLISGSSEDLFSALPYEVRHLGLIENEEQLASAYQAADVFVCPSIEDSGPMMINQSIMTGTPVVSFEMGVAFDLVLPGKTGYRAKLKDSEDLAKGINDILDLNEEAFNHMSSNCHELGLKLCHPNLIKKQFRKLFNESKLENQGRDIRFMTPCTLEPASASNA